MGSAYEWGEDSQTLCNHTIPAEIVAKIVAKIKVCRSAPTVGGTVGTGTVRIYFC